MMLSTPSSYYRRVSFGFQKVHWVQASVTKLEFLLTVKVKRNRYLIIGIAGSTKESDKIAKESCKQNPRSMGRKTKKGLNA